MASHPIPSLPYHSSHDTVTRTLSHSHPPQMRLVTVEKLACMHRDIRGTLNVNISVADSVAGTTVIQCIHDTHKRNEKDGEGNERKSRIIKYFKHQKQNI